MRPASPTRLAALILWFALGPALAQVDVTPQHSGVEVSLRGIAAVNAQVAWASGEKSTVLRTIDGGRHWQRVQAPGDGALDFRDVEAFDANTALIMSIGKGDASRVYRTHDGGAHWTQVLRNHAVDGFFDCMTFAGQRGWLMGDPVDGRFQVYATTDQGRSWHPVQGPKADTDESAFAASGTCIAGDARTRLIGSGGARSRLSVFREGDGDWQQIDSTMTRSASSAGVFGLTPWPHGDGWLAVGGDYRRESAPGNAVHITVDAQGRPHVQALPAPPGFRSGVACLSTGLHPCLVVGPSGIDRWDDGHWTSLSKQGYHAIDLVGTGGWASGPGGHIARIEVHPTPP
jgi:photosystem II stability/assembly factor-like uncharacterized protein